MENTTLMEDDILNATPDQPVGSGAVPDESLLARFRDAGDREALAELFRRHADAAYRTACRVTGGARDAEDAVQAAFLHILSHPGQYRGEASVKAWILGIVANAVREAMRRQSRRDRRERMAGMETGEVESFRPEQEEMKHLVMGRLQELPERYRLPLWLHYHEGLSYREVSGALAVSENTVKKQLQRGLEHLRQAMAYAGVPVSVLALTTTLSSSTAEAAPATLLAAIPGIAAGNVVAAGVGGGVAAAGWSLSAKLAAGAVAAGVAVGGIGVATGVFRGSPAQVPGKADNVAPKEIDPRLRRVLDHKMSFNLDIPQPPRKGELERVCESINRTLPPDMEIEFVEIVGDPEVVENMEKEPDGKLGTVTVYTGNGPLGTVGELTNNVMGAGFNLCMIPYRQRVILYRSLEGGRANELNRTWSNPDPGADDKARVAAAETVGKSGDMFRIKGLAYGLGSSHERVAAAAYRGFVEASHRPACLNGNRGWGANNFGFFGAFAREPGVMENATKWFERNRDKLDIDGVRLCGLLRIVASVPVLKKRLDTKAGGMFQKALIELTGADQGLAETRSEAARALGRIGGEEARNALLAVLRDRTDEAPVRATCAKALGDMGDSSVVVFLVEFISDKKGHVGIVKAVAEALGEIRDPAAVGPLLDAVEMADEHSITFFGQEAVQAVACIRDPSALDRLHRLMRHPNSWVGRAAIDAVGQFRNPASTGPLMNIIGGGGRDTLDGASAAAALVRIGDASVIPALTDLAENGRSETIRESAMTALARFQRPEASDVLFAIVEKYKDNDKCYRAWRAASQISGDARAEDFFRKLLARDQSPAARGIGAYYLPVSAWKEKVDIIRNDLDINVRRGAAQSWANVQFIPDYPGQKEALRELLKTETDPNIRFSLYGAVYHADKSVKARDALLAALRTEVHSEVKFEIVFLLTSRFCDEASAKGLSRVLEEDPDPKFRARVANQMLMMNSPNAKTSQSLVEELSACLAKESDPEVRKAIEKTLEWHRRFIR
ncbi:MAG: sigma-70 family RNA polymerase sigma factor [Planctomycetota bacterium]